VASDPARYRFGPLEGGGAIAGLTWGQLAAIAAGLGGLVVSLHAVGGPAGGLLGLALAAAGLMAALLRAGGRPPVAWASVVGGFVGRRLTGRHRYRSVAPTLGIGGADDRRALPRSLGGLRILSVPTSGGDVGIVADGQTWTAVLAVEAGAFALLELADKERRLARWGAVLSGLARRGSPVGRLQWIERTVAEPVDELGRYLRDELALEADHRSVRSYLELLDDAGPAARRHETFVCLQIDARRAGHALRQAGGCDDAAGVVLLRELQRLSGQLLQAEVVVRGALSPRLVARAIRLGFDPGGRVTLDRRGGGDAEASGVAPGDAGPMAADEGWRTYRADAALHATYWIAEWPRVEVGADFLLPFLLGATARRTVSVVVEPLDPARAIRSAENARTNEASDDELRARLGFVSTARRRRQQEALATREEEIADGHAACRFSGYVTVSAASSDELEAACADVEQSAQMARLELRPLYGEQAAAFTYTLPLCRGLR
jgi:hypothetical protein